MNKLDNKLVFDGEESDFYTFSIQYICSSCSQKDSILANDMIPLGKIDTNFLPKNSFKHLKLNRRSGGNTWLNSKGLRVYGKNCKCSQCGTNNLVIAGIGEVQPSRFIVTLEGIIAVK